jgi:HAD superfamily hydrolase (TIGR01509 family)
MGNPLLSFIYVLQWKSAVIIMHRGRPEVKVYSPPEDSQRLMKGDIAKRIREVKAVVFDLDDTLVESTVDFPKFKGLVIERIVSHGESRKDYGPNETVVAMINRYEARMREGGVPDKEIKRRLAELDKIMDEVEMERVSETVAYDGAARLLELLRKNEIKIGVLTRGCDEYANKALSKTGLLGLVDVLECRNSDTKPKPDPAAYLKLVAELGVRKEETVFVGDHPLDALCAANAGVPFIAVRTGDVPEESLRRAGSVEVFKDIGELADWLSRILSG